MHHAINKTTLLFLPLNSWLPLTLKLTFSSQNRSQKFSRRMASLGPCQSGKEDRKLLSRRENLLVSDGVFSSPFDSTFRSVNHAVSNVEGLKLKITAHKTLTKFVLA